MKLDIVACDCLVLNWALPVRILPPPPPPLAYEGRLCEGDDHVFVSALLFFQENLQIKGLPLRLSYPQFVLAVHTLERGGMPCLLLESVLLPAWVLPAARLLGHEIAATARFDYPRPSRTLQRGEWIWAVGSRQELRVRAQLASPQVAAGPRLDSWGQIVNGLRGRRRAYFRRSNGLAPLDISFPGTTPWPLQIAVEETDLLAASLDQVGEASWPEPHSAWLWPEVSSQIELATEKKKASLSKRMPEPAPSQRIAV